MICNPYEQLYKKNVKKVSMVLTVKQAEEMATQMSLIYNAFGFALKDMISLLSKLYSTQNIQNKSDNQTHKQKIPQTIIIQQKNDLSLDEKYQHSNSNSFKQPDFNKYMININKKPTSKVQIPQKYSFNQTKQSKTTINHTKKSKPIQRIQVVRGKKQRQALNGYSCIMCQNFYKALGQDFIDANGNNKLCNDCSRHRSNLPPTNFHTDFSQQFGFDD